MWMCPKEVTTTFDIWKNMVVNLGKNITTKEMKEIKLLFEQKMLDEFSRAFQLEVKEFAQHVFHTGYQFKAQKELSSDLLNNHFYI